MKRSVFKSLTKFLMVGSLVMPTFAFGKETSFSATTPTSKSTSEISFKKFQEDLKTITRTSPAFKKLANAPSKVFEKSQGLAHPLQTMSLIWVLAVVETYRQQSNLGPLQNHEIDSELLWTIADQIVNDMEIYSGMVGAGAISLPMGKAFQELHGVLSQNISKKFLVEFLHSGAVSFITFVGWEAGSQLWKEAIFQLNPDENESKILEDFKILKLLSLQSTAPERELFLKVLDKAFEILLFQNPSQTRDWIYNTWRLRLATGEFATLVTGMVSGGVAAGTIFPPGFIVGALGGLVGGVATLLIPHEWTAAMTSSIRSARSSVNQLNLNTTYISLYQVGKAYQKNREQKQVPMKYQFEGRYRAMDDAFQLREERRNDSFTAKLEDIYDSKVRLQEATLLYALAKQRLTMDLDQQTTNHVETRRTRSLKRLNEKKLNDLLADASLHIQDSTHLMTQRFEQIQNELNEELKLFKSLVERRDLFFPATAKQKLNTQILRLIELKEQLNWLQTGILTEDAGSSENPEIRPLIQASQGWLNLFHGRGFYTECMINPESAQCPFSAAANKAQ
ncbi:MAG TPA: hypothetical protein DCL41_03705 [Bdellovibrionales bacterium]|mgnify:CR=1 FL=1|nr:hypothetical protein [Pseudobdellovibrionaceae bacterium]HAG90947.1 hypothetical protein [Bdellovibrionales bacterium]